MARPTLIAPSILTADFGHLSDEIAALEAAGADWIHLDVMDGHFVPNISFGPAVVSAVRAETRLPLDVHLMISPADSYIEAFAKAGADSITVHAEAGPHLDRSLQTIRELGKRAGVALNPATSADAISHVLERIDLVLVMTVNPGFGGQAFIPAMLDKVRGVAAQVAGLDVEIEVDGGIGPAAASQAAAAGANVFVAGSAVLQGGPRRYADNIAAIRSAVRGGDR